MTYRIQNSGLITNPHELSEFVRVRTSSLLISLHIQATTPSEKSTTNSQRTQYELIAVCNEPVAIRCLNILTSDQKQTCNELERVRMSSYKFVVNYRYLARANIIPSKYLTTNLQKTQRCPYQFAVKWNQLAPPQNDPKKKSSNNTNQMIHWWLTVT